MVAPVSVMFPTSRSLTTKTSPAKLVFAAVSVSAERRSVEEPIFAPKEMSPRPALTTKASRLSPIAMTAPKMAISSAIVPREVIVEVPPPDKVTEFENSIPPAVEVTPTLSIVAMLAIFRALLKLEAEPLNITPLLPVSVVMPVIAPPPVTPLTFSVAPAPVAVTFNPLLAVNRSSSALLRIRFVETPPVPTITFTPEFAVKLIDPVTPSKASTATSFATTASELLKVDAVVIKKTPSTFDVRSVTPCTLPPPVTPLTVIDAPAPVAVIASDPASVMKSSSVSVRLSPPTSAVPRKMSTPLLPVMLISPVTLIALSIEMSPALAIVSDVRVSLSPTAPTNETCPAPAVNVKA